MSADNEELREMVDYAIDMLSAELPLIEQEYGWTEALQKDVLGRLESMRDALAAGSSPGAPELLAKLDAAGVSEGTLREFCSMIESAAG
ncbi:MAG: hypothetical protein R3270_02220 [Gammaproteobacteria bacterium]|nr:hypothetical protein [Gammaproteobacteria bacterium]